MDIIFFLVILILSIVIHEVSHGYVADMLGDPTARLSGRLTLNPLPHIDLLGSIILPGLMILSGTPFLFGWAKPVPYNPHNLKNQRWGEALVAGSGPLVNIIIAVFFGVLIQLRSVIGLSEAFVGLALVVIFLNVVLAIINMIPIPPIDGSKVLRALLPYRLWRLYDSLEQLSYRLGPFALVAVLLLIIFVFGPFLSTAIFWVTSLLTGLSFPEISLLMGVR